MGYFLYQDKRGEWRWRKRAKNGKIIGASTEGYFNEWDCIENMAENGYDAEKANFNYEPEDPDDVVPEELEDDK